ncbi:MAG: replication-associated recombination protein A [Nitrosomonas sp.]|nr:replication-associated recombination protein A [Nitrosomonas sp.]
MTEFDFSSQLPLSTPLAERLRPQSLEEVIGQAHLLGVGSPLRNAFETGKPHSMILWGPPGSGKTTLARLMSHAFDAEFIAISAVLAGVKDIREAIDRAKNIYQQSERHTVLFVDEVHRFNKAQQDAFLPYVEQGLITFIGATTENPSFEVNRALLSRAQVYTLFPLSQEELQQLFDRTHRSILNTLSFSDEAKQLIIQFADGDARRLLNLLEQLSIAAEAETYDTIDADQVHKALTRSLRNFDKGKDAFYDQISALHKSIRGSSPDAALYWMCRMLDGGVDPIYIARRLIRAAVEDIGLADPRAYKKARSTIEHDISHQVPLHLRNAPTRLMEEMGYGKKYRYPHDEPEAYAAGENYFPETLSPITFYHPTTRGLESKISEKLEKLAKMDQYHTKKT